MSLQRGLKGKLWEDVLFYLEYLSNYFRVDSETVDWGHCLSLWGCEMSMGYLLGCTTQPQVPTQPPSLSNNCSFWALCCYVVCVEAMIWGRCALPSSLKMSQHRCAVPDPLCEATALQKHSCALFPVSIRSLVQIRDFLLCVCWWKAWALFLTYHIWLGSQCYLVACYTACVLILCRVIMLWADRSLLDRAPAFPVTSMSSMGIYSQTNSFWDDAHGHPGTHLSGAVSSYRSWGGRRSSMTPSNRRNGLWEMS